MRNAFQQGQADGLCGIYALLNFLRRTPDWRLKQPDKALWHLLETARQLDWFTPQYLTEGYEDYQLKAILDLQFANYRMPYQSLYLRDVEQAAEYGNFYDLACAVAHKRGALVVHHESRQHWLLVMATHDGLSTIDSADAEQPVRPLSSRQRSLSLEWGLVILPKPSAKFEIVL